MKVVPWFASSVLMLASSTLSRGEAAHALELFTSRVQPLLESRCISCHGPDTQKAGLRLDFAEAALRGGDQGPALVPGKPDDSLLLKAVLHAIPDLEMPPKERLSPADTVLLREWIQGGAPWPATPPPQSTRDPGPSPTERIGDAWSDPRNPIVRIFNGQRLELWSLRPVRTVTPPAPVRDRRFQPRNPIDLFIHQRLSEAGLTPAPEADRRTLARRVHFDLTGLPPPPSEVAAFLADTTPGAYERLVDRLLQSPRYGEHQARQWLDVVRYSDSNGFDWDEYRPDAWRFRDYVVRAFNSDKPFSEFVREQLAGDELLAGPPRDARDQDRLVATGYLRIGPQDNSAPLFNEQARARAEWLADLTETTGSAFLGLTLSCCRCHDHKYDPLSQADHFRLRAFFQGVKYGDDLALDLAADQSAIEAHNARLDTEARPLREEREAILGHARERIRAGRIAALSDDERRTLAMTSDPQPQDFQAKARAIARKVQPSDDEARKAFTADERSRDESIANRLAALDRQRRAFTRGLFATDQGTNLPPTHILFQGDPSAPRAEVAPGFLSALDPNPALPPPPPNPRTSGRRLALADWIAGPENPLTARVLVNRAWQSFFGRGIVSTPNDFGLAGARPTHPELLDWLASEFLKTGGSLKSLHRLIVTSATYRQASAKHLGPADPPGRGGDADTLWARHSLRRLSAEQLRDAVLAVSGTLRETAGGKPVWPALPPEILQANPAFLDDNAERTKGWYPSPEPERTVRSLYLVQKRTVRVPFLETFDLPENSVSCPQRNVSVVAPQALSLLNGEEAVAASRAFAARVRNEAGASPDAQIRRAWALALQREPRDEEARLARAYLRTASLAELCRVLLNLNEFAYLD